MAKLVHDEASFREQYEDSLGSVGVYVVYMSSMTRTGVPDDYLCGPGFSGWQELKFVDQLPLRRDSGVLGHRLTGQQREFLDKVYEQGHLAIVAVGAPASLMGSQWPRGEVGVSFFLPQAFDKQGQITRGQFEDCGHRAPMLDGPACLRVIGLMAQAPREALVYRRGRGQLQLKLKETKCSPTQ